MLKTLTAIRKQLADQQAIINECLGQIDDLIVAQMTGNHENDASSQVIELKDFPSDRRTNKARLIYILEQSKGLLTAKEVKEKLQDYNYPIENVDQALVHLAKDKIIGVNNAGPRKRYFAKD